MSTFCLNCGTQLRAGAKFCQACGRPASQPDEAALPPTMPIGSVPPSAQPSFAPPQSPPPTASFGSSDPPAYAPPQPYAPAPQAAGKKSGGALKAVLITLAVFILLVVTAVGGLFFFVREKIRQAVNVSDKGVVINSPAGEVGISTQPETSEEKLGMPIYQPSTTTRENVSFSGKSGEGQGAVVVSAFTTEDSADEVADFYREHLGGRANFVENRRGGEGEGGGEVVMTSQDEQGMRTVVIKPNGGENGQTKFIITSVTGTKFKGRLPQIPKPPAAPPPPPPQ